MADETAWQLSFILCPLIVVIVNLLGLFLCLFVLSSWWKKLI